MKNYSYEQITPKKYSKEIFLNLVLRSLSESIWKEEKIDIARLTMVIQSFTESSNDSRACFIAKQGDEVIGLLAASITADTILGKSMASEMMWYVTPEHRRSKVTHNLLDLYEKWAKKQDVECITMAHYCNETEPLLSRVFEKKGFKRMEVTYIKDIKD